MPGSTVEVHTGNTQVLKDRQTPGKKIFIKVRSATLVVLSMFVYRIVRVVLAAHVHAVVKLPMGRGQDQAHPLVSLGFGLGTDGVYEH